MNAEGINRRRQRFFSKSIKEEHTFSIPIFHYTGREGCRKSFADDPDLPDLICGE
jgi:hypothetical protein